MDGAESSSKSGRRGAGGFQVSFESRGGVQSAEEEAPCTQEQGLDIEQEERQRRQGKKVRRNTKYSAVSEKTNSKLFDIATNVVYVHSTRGIVHHSMSFYLT